LKPTEEQPEKRRLRSNYSYEDEDDDEQRAPNFDLNDLEYCKYDGAIIYASDFVEVAENCDQIIQFVEKQDNQKVPLGFDMEWTFNWKTGAEKTSVIQICTNLDKCYVLHLVNLKKIPQALVVLMHHPKILLHGVNIKNDIRKLERDFPIFKSDQIIENVLDLGTHFNEICVSSGRWSLERLAIQVTRLRISKDRKIRMSKWHFFPLTDDQKMYAAIDVYVSSFLEFEIIPASTEISKHIIFPPISSNFQLFSLV
jgi:hypothetical protein